MCQVLVALAEPSGIGVCQASVRVSSKAHGGAPFFFGGFLSAAFGWKSAERDAL